MYCNSALPVIARREESRLLVALESFICFEMSCNISARVVIRYSDWMSVPGWDSNPNKRGSMTSPDLALPLLLLVYSDQCFVFGLVFASHAVYYWLI